MRVRRSSSGAAMVAVAHRAVIPQKRAVCGGIEEEEEDEGEEDELVLVRVRRSVS